jgi:amino acid transporter
MSVAARIGPTENAPGGQPALRKGIARIPMILLGVGGAIGTGALFSGTAMAAVAGPALIIAWLVGAVIYTFIGVTYVDMSTRFPEAGGPARYAAYTHGDTANLINSVGSLVWYLFIPPIEAIATMEGFAYFDSGLLTAKGFPTLTGSLVALGLLLVFVPFNFYGIRLFARLTNVLGGAKIVLYLALAIGFIVVLTRAENFTRFGGFSPFGASGILAAVPVAMFAFGGIRVIPDFAEEATDARHLKSGILLTILIQSLIYLIFAVAFVGAISWSTLSVKAGAWASLTKVAGDPFVVLSTHRGVGGLLALAVIVAILGPFVVGYVYQGAGTRVLMAMSRSGYVSKRMESLHARHAIPAQALVVMVVVGAVLALLTAPVPKIYSLIDDAVVGGYISFGVVPAAMLALRRQRHEKISPGVALAAAIGFGGASLIVYWSGWPSVPYAVILTAVGVLVFSALCRVKDLGHAIWYVVWILFLTLMAGIGSVGKANVVSFDVGSVIVAVVSIAVILPWAVFSRLPTLRHLAEPASGESSGAERPVGA